MTNLEIQEAGNKVAYETVLAMLFASQPNLRLQVLTEAGNAMAEQHKDSPLAAIMTQQETDAMFEVVRETMARIGRLAAPISALVFPAGENPHVDNNG